MAEQLGDQGSLSKNLQEREGADYRRARPHLGYSGLFPTRMDSVWKKFCLASSGWELTSRAGIIEDMFSALLLAPWAFPYLFSPGQEAQSETQVRDHTQDHLLRTVCNFRATYAAQDIQPFRGKVLEKVAVRGPWIRRDLGLEKEQ